MGAKPSSPTLQKIYKPPVLNIQKASKPCSNFQAEVNLNPPIPQSTSHNSNKKENEPPQPKEFPYCTRCGHHKFNHLGNSILIQEAVLSLRSRKAQDLIPFKDKLFYVDENLRFSSFIEVKKGNESKFEQCTDANGLLAIWDEFLLLWSPQLGLYKEIEGKVTQAKILTTKVDIEIFKLCRKSTIWQNYLIPHTFPLNAYKIDHRQGTLNLVKSLNFVNFPIPKKSKHLVSIEVVWDLLFVVYEDQQDMRTALVFNTLDSVQLFEELCPQFFTHRIHSIQPFIQSDCFNNILVFSSDQISIVNSSWKILTQFEVPNETKSVLTRKNWIYTNSHNEIRLYTNNGVCVQKISLHLNCLCTEFWKNYFVVSLPDATIRIYSGTPSYWHPKNHLTQPKYLQNQIFTILLMRLTNLETGEPKYPEACWYMLPRDILYDIFNYLPIGSFVSQD